MPNHHFVDPSAKWTRRDLWAGVANTSPTRTRGNDEFVEVLKWGSPKNDISVRVEGLPEGWKGSVTNWPVKIHRRANAPATLGVVVNSPTPSAGCGLRAPITLTADQSEITIPLQVSEWKAGDYGITIARSWASDLRGGRPGPCTPLIRLRVLPVK
jgi:hypothetical protein